MSPRELVYDEASERVQAILDAAEELQDIGENELVGRLHAIAWRLWLMEQDDEDASDQDQ